MVWNVIIAKKHRTEQKCVTVFGRNRIIIIYPINTVEGILGRHWHWQSRTWKWLHS